MFDKTEVNTKRSSLRFDIHVLMKLKQRHRSFDCMLEIHIIKVTIIHYESTLSE
jgi:hypothetical protein